MTETISPVVTESCYDRLTVDAINTRKGSGIPQYIYLCGFAKRYLHEFCRTFSFEARLIYDFSSL